MTGDRFAADMVNDLLEHGASLGHIARIVGVSRSSVSRWRSGERQPSGYALFRLARLHRSVVFAKAS